MMHFTVFTLFPGMFAPVQESILRRAQDADLLEIKLIDFRNYAFSKHKNVDDVPYGGGAGMVLKPEPLFRAVEDLPPAQGQRKIVLLSPQGKVFKQEMAREWSTYDELIFLCGHYEGFDERIRSLADVEVSLGDFVLTGGELAAMVMIDATARLLPGVLGESLSAADDTHSQGLLEYPQYTRPPEFAGQEVPEKLLSGHHAKIERWRKKEALKRTGLRRPDLFLSYEIKQEDYELLEELAEEYAQFGVWRGRWAHLKPPEKRKRHSRRREKSDSVTE